MLEGQDDVLARDTGFQQLICNPFLSAVVLDPDLAVPEIDVDHATVLFAPCPFGALGAPLKEGQRLLGLTLRHSPGIMRYRTSESKS